MSGSGIKSSSFFLSLACFMLLDKSLNLSLTYFPICKMRLIIIFAYFTKVLEEWIITVFISIYNSLWGKHCFFFFLYTCNSTGVLLCNGCCIKGFTSPELETVLTQKSLRPKETQHEHERNHVKRGRNTYAQEHTTGPCQRWGFPSWHFKAFLSLPPCDWLLCCTWTAGQLYSHRLGVVTRNRHKNADWLICRLSDHADNWESRELGKFELAFEVGPSSAAINAALASAWCCCHGRDFHASIRSESVKSKELSIYWHITFKRTN